MAETLKNARQRLEAKEREKVAFFELAEKLAQSSDRKEQKRLKEELARMTFGDL